jgi:Ran GTPase-activating protein (RanGAP) involved in mRNA processing and transport
MFNALLQCKDVEIIKVELSKNALSTTAELNLQQY